MKIKDNYNVIFIMADQMKATASSLYSEIGVETPNLKRMKGKLAVLIKNELLLRKTSLIKKQLFLNENQ